MSAGTDQYVMGNDDREHRRLALQGSLLNPITEELLRRAGICGGMRVLDIGCGIGDVSLIVSKLVGNDGEVIAIDTDPAALQTALKRAHDLRCANISFVNSSIQEFQPEERFDAVTGRHILIHTREPFDIMRSIRDNLREGGVACLQEFDFSVIHPTYPVCPIRDELLRLFKDFFSKVAHGNMGTQLYHLFVKAGFPAPECRAEYLISGGANTQFYEWAAESMRSIYPTLKAIGLAPVVDLNFETLAEQLREEAVGQGSCSPAPVMVGGFGRKS
ncbi:MAG: class I SAM-dependent methyltransferase [Bryobacteraceae bacterium]|nr:class I SAM-dependent methyltransferase [Bryobacteraceae bacterium]